MITHDNKPIEEILDAAFNDPNYPCHIVIVGDMNKPSSIHMLHVLQKYKKQIEQELQINVGIANFYFTNPTEEEVHEDQR